MSLKTTFGGLFLVLCFLTGWQFASDLNPFVRLLVSSPAGLATFVFDKWFELLGDIVHTATIAMLGLVLATFFGGGLGILGAMSQSLGRRMTAFATLMQSVPLIVFTPFAVIAFGVGAISQVLLASIMAVFPLIIGVVSSTDRARAEYEELARLYNLSPLERVLDLYLPYMLPSIVSSMRICAGLAILGTVIAEFVGSPRGLGRNIFMGTVRIDPELMMSSLVLTLLLSLLVHHLFLIAENYASWWKSAEARPFGLPRSWFTG